MKIIIKNPCLFALLQFIVSLSLSGMENSLFKKSTITQIPTTERGLGIWSCLTDGFYGEPQATAIALGNGSLPIKNVSTYNKINRSIETLSGYTNAKENTDLLISIILLCRQGVYRGHISINDLPFLKAHNYLTEENKQLQSNLQINIKKNTYSFTNKINVYVATLKELTNNTIKNIKTINDEYTTEKNSTIKSECNEIRKIKEALFHLHRLNASNIIPHNTKPSISDHYCSDDEKEITNLPKSYSDGYIIKEKTGLNETINKTTEAVKQLLTKLEEINTLLNKISAI